MVEIHQLDHFEQRIGVEMRRNPGKFGLGQLFIGQQRIDRGDDRGILGIPMAVISMAIEGRPHLFG